VSRLKEGGYSLGTQIGSPDIDVSHTLAIAGSARGGERNDIRGKREDLKCTPEIAPLSEALERDFGVDVWRAHAQHVGRRERCREKASQSEPGSRPGGPFGDCVLRLVVCETRGPGETQDGRSDGLERIEKAAIAQISFPTVGGPRTAPNPTPCGHLHERPVDVQSCEDAAQPGREPNE
jgi:hypothetical protein